LEREIRQGRPFASASHEAAVALFRTADLLRRRLGRVVEPHGITLQQYNVLRILRGAGPAGLPTLEIAQRMIERNPGATRLLDRLAAKGLVHRERCPEDRRQVMCGITPSGLDVLLALEQAMRDGDREFFAALPASELDGLLRSLEALRAGAVGEPDQEATEHEEEEKETT
jgi:DNA-binding MarR family transcriptional regulator